MTMDFEELKAYTKRANGSGESLYDHITSLLLRLNQDKPENALKELQALSVKVKKTNPSQQLFKELAQVPANAALKTKLLSSLRQVQSLFATLPQVSAEDRVAVEEYLRAMAAAAESEDEGAQAKAASLLPSVMQGPHIPNVMGHASLLEWGGVNMGREEMFKVSLSLRRLTQDVAGLASVRFFGKIFGTGADYYIFEAKRVVVKGAKPQDDAVTKKEATGTGANEFVYFAANSLEGKFEELPDVLPEQIITSRSMRRFFSGNLRAPVKGYPRFPWPEASYLRAQIARIAASTIISPKGLFAMSEDPDNEDEDAPEIMTEDPDFEVPGLEELATPDGWAHHRAWIYKQGRTKKWEAPEGEEEEEEPAEEEEEEEEEEPVPMLNGLELDEAKFPVWRFQSHGGQHAVVSVTSLQWPGAVSVQKDKTFCNIYLGWGQEYLPTIYTPPALPAVASEYVSNFNPEEAEEDETDPMVEQVDPLPPKELDDEEGEGDEGDDEE